MDATQLVQEFKTHFQEELKLISKLSTEINGCNESIKELKESKATNEQIIENIKAENKELIDRLNSAQKSLQNTQKDISTLKEEKADLGAKYESIQGKLEQYIKAYKKQKDRIAELEQQIATQQEELQMHQANKELHKRNFKGDEGANTEKARQVNQARGQSSADKLMSAIAYYINNPQNTDNLIDMQWLKKYAQLEETQIRTIVKQIAEGQRQTKPQTSKVNEWLQAKRQFKNTQ